MQHYKIKKIKLLIRKEKKGQMRKDLEDNVGFRMVMKDLKIYKNKKQN